MEGLGVLLFLVAIIASLIEQARKGQGTGRQAPPQRRPQRPRLPRQSAPGRSPERPELPAGRAPSPAAPAPSREGREGRASEMIPEDFWRELIGLPPLERAPRAPAPSGDDMETPERDLPSWDEEAIAAREEKSREIVVREERAREEYRRPLVVRREAEVVSLEAPPPPPELRHAQFHAREARRSAPPPRTTAVAAGPPPLRARLRNPAAVREGFILQELLGPPKALREE